MKLYIYVDELYPYYTFDDSSYYENEKSFEVDELFYREYKVAMTNFFYYQNKLEEMTNIT